MHLEILTPEGKVFNGEVSSVRLPGSAEKGSFTILKGHAPIISSLQAGKVLISTGNGEETYTIKGGFVEALNDKISILVEGLEDAA